MPEVYTASNAQYCWILKNILESEGIECEIKNDNLQLIAGDVPFDQTWPSLSIINESDLPRAKELIEKNRPKLSDIPSFCPKCDAEEIELEQSGNALVFDRFICKKCGNIWRKK